MRTLYLVEDGGEAERVLPPGHVPLVVCPQGDEDLLEVEAVPAVRLLVVGAEEGAVAAAVDVDALVQEELDHDGVLGHDGEVEGVLPVVLLRHVDVVDHLREGLEQAPRQQEVRLQGPNSMRMAWS